MHTDPIPVESRGGHRMRGSLNAPQGDGRKPLAHVLTGLLTLVLSLVVGHYSHILQGQQGPKGTTTVISKTAQDYGVCAYFGWDSAAHAHRFQLTAPVADGSGAYCKKGTLISVVPGKP